MAEISRTESIEYFNKRIEVEQQIINLPTCDKEVVEVKKKHIAYFELAISDREKLEKIEQIFEIKGFNEYPCTYEDMAREVLKIIKGDLMEVK